MTCSHCRAPFSRRLYRTWDSQGVCLACCKAACRAILLDTASESAPGEPLTGGESRQDHSSAVDMTVPTKGSWSCLNSHFVGVTNPPDDALERYLGKTPDATDERHAGHVWPVPGCLRCGGAA